MSAVAGRFGALVLLAGVAIPKTAAARDAICEAAPAIAAVESTDTMLTAAEALVTPLDRPRARALYLAILARDAKDDEAAVGLADILAWTGRWAEADEVLAVGLAAAPLAPELLSRRSRVSASRGDVTAAAHYIAEAERVTPLDLEVREARDRLFLGQARLGQRLELFPAGYDDVTTTDASAMQRWRRLRFELGATVITRHGALRETRSGLIKTTIIDGRPSFGAYYHYDGGGWVGAAFGVSAPALALPRYATTVSGFHPLGRIFSLYLSTAYWQYRDDRDVVIVSPALGIAVTDAVDITLRYWLTTVIVSGTGAGDTTDYVHSAGIRVGWRPDTRLTLGADYTYGVQLERNPSATDLLQLRSHIVSVFARKLLSRSFGVDASLSLERRASLGSGPTVVGEIGEVGVFTRW